MLPRGRPRTGQKISMPPRSKAPGLKRGRHRLPYWIARQVVRDPMGFPEPCVALPADADEGTLQDLCQQYTARLFAWIAEREAEGDGDVRASYDGSVLGLSRLFQAHLESPFHTVKRNTRKTYTDSLKVIEATVGQRAVRRVNVIDVKRWYKLWKAPKVEGGRERIDRAHDAVSMFRMCLRFAAALKHAECEKLDAALAKMRFEKGGAREEEMTYAQVVAFIRKALELGQGAMPQERAMHMAIGVAAQFETLLRPMDIIGYWEPLSLARRKGQAEPQTFGEEMWSGYFTWENIPGWRWRMKTSKSKYRAAAEFDLTRYSLLFPLLEAVPHDQRHGAIVKGEHGLPVRYRSYSRWFRTIARAAGIPDEVWNMDARAGGATEAEESGAELEAIQAALTHSKKETTLRYIRRRSTKIAQLADARDRKRTSEEGQS